MLHCLTLKLLHPPVFRCNDFFRAQFGVHSLVPVLLFSLLDLLARFFAPNLAMMFFFFETIGQVKCKVQCDMNMQMTVRGLYIATGQYSSLCVSAVVLNLGGDDIVEVVQDREQVDSEREKVEVRDKEKGDKTRTNNARSNM